MTCAARSLLDLPTNLLDSVCTRAAQLGVREPLCRTCFTLFETGLLHAPYFRFQMHRERCDRLLSPRVVAALQARTCKLALTLEQEEEAGGGQYSELLAHVLSKLGSCAAVDCCELGRTGYLHLDTPQPLDCTPDLAQRLLSSFPSLTALSIHGYSLTSSGLASLLAHPPLSLCLQQLDLTYSTLLQPHPPRSGVVIPANLFTGLKLQHLSLDVSHAVRLPDLQPLAQHLTRLHIGQASQPLPAFTPALSQLLHLQQLTVTHACSLSGLAQLLQALPQLHTLWLPALAIEEALELDTLLRATQLTSVQVGSVHMLTSSRAEAPCSWQRLEVRGTLDCTSAAYLPLHSLTQPLLLNWLSVTAGEAPDPLLAAAVRNLTQVCKVAVKMNTLGVDMMGEQASDPEDSPLSQDGADGDTSVLQHLGALLHPLRNTYQEVMFTDLMGVSAACIPAIAPLCHGCTRLVFHKGSLTPSLALWRQLLQRMPALMEISLVSSAGAATAVMCKALRRMALQPWARWLDIHISSSEPTLSQSCQSINHEFGDASRPARFKAHFAVTPED